MSLLLGSRPRASELTARLNVSSGSRSFVCGRSFQRSGASPFSPPESLISSRTNFMLLGPGQERRQRKCGDSGPLAGPSSKSLKSVSLRTRVPRLLAPSSGFREAGGSPSSLLLISAAWGSAGVALGNQLLSQFTGMGGLGFHQLHQTWKGGLSRKSLPGKTGAEETGWGRRACQVWCGCGQGHIPRPPVL